MSNQSVMDALMPQSASQSVTSLRKGSVTKRGAKVPVQAVVAAAEPTRMIVTHSKDWWSIGSEFVLIGGSLAALAYMFNQLITKDSNNPESTQKQVAEHIKQKLIARMKKSGRDITSFNTNSYEDSLLDMIVLPQQIEVRFNDIGGLDNIKRDLTETVLVPLMYPQLTRSSRLCQPPLGVLFYGPPGTGKSMMAKAIARETNATFINVDMSRLMSKWYGDSQKYISALFSLARKMAPSIIWIDEIDALFSQRSRTDHSADVYNKALFLSLWDGLANDIYQSKQQKSNRNRDSNSNKNKTKNKNKSNATRGGGGPQQSNNRKENEISSSFDGGTAGVMVLGATNRPQEVDEAFLRRMSRQYEYTMPDLKTRTLILTILLQFENCDDSVNIERISQSTQNYSGSDLKELCKYAATLPLREYIRTQTHRIHGIASQSHDTPNGYGNKDSKKESKKPWLLNMAYKSEDNNNTNEDEDEESGVNTSASNECTEIFQELNNGSMLKRKENVHLRPITMNDFDIALKHIKSTMQAHRQHKQRYSKGSLYSMVDPFLASMGASGFAGAGGAMGGIPSNNRRSRYTGPPTVSSKSSNDDKNNYNGGLASSNYDNGGNNISNNRTNSNNNGVSGASMRAAGESADPMVDMGVDVE